MQLAVQVLTRDTTFRVLLVVFEDVCQTNPQRFVILDRFVFIEISSEDRVRHAFDIVLMRVTHLKQQQRADDVSGDGGTIV